MQPLAIVIGTSPRATRLAPALAAAQWRVLTGATVFDAIKVLNQCPVAIVCDGSVGELKLNKLLSAPGRTAPVYMLEHSSTGTTTSLSALDDAGVVAALVEKHGGSIPKPKWRTALLEPIEFWWTREGDQLLLHVAVVDNEARMPFLELLQQGHAVRQPALPVMASVKTGDPVTATWLIPRGEMLNSVMRLLSHERALLSDQATCTIGHEVCDALVALHAAASTHGMVRRPSVWLTDAGDLRLLFAGIGALHEADRTRERRGRGLPRRKDDLAPEQLQPQLGPVGPATDVYQLGHLLFELFNGRGPFGRADTFAAFRAVLTEERVAPNAPAPVAELVRRMLAVAPSGRPTAEEVRAVLAPFATRDVRDELATWVARYRDELADVE